ncbi:hypothetical protein LCGC14_0534900 [marine sediment metagenome]|uniref:Uncharacterized protein n=1 Tax=marine sediment metagenome TaxID=412755 RepID=A0A0F9SCT1_9ZZZZ
MTAVISMALVMVGLVSMVFVVNMPAFITGLERSIISIIPFILIALGVVINLKGN